ncbi:MAG TPA: pirin family protein [Thermoanaerobaculia bacterium]|nr:pirin family protein [Thermoanaerobaculia bacterium]
MIQIRKSDERGHFDHGWLNTYHTFSFADYYDSSHMGFRDLRVINEDRVEPGRGFGTHGHRDMEIISYVLEGGLQHRDNIGNGSVIRPGDVQRMSAGTGVLHSEFNASKEESMHFLQIWILPGKTDLAPGYEEKHFSEEEKRGRLRLVGSQGGRDGSVTIHQDVDLYASIIPDGSRVEHRPAAGRHGWVQVLKGEIRLGKDALSGGDGAAISDEELIALEARGGDAEVLLFDLK